MLALAAHQTVTGGELLPVLSLAVALLAVFVGPFITLWISRRQMDLSRRIANKQIIAPMREEWISDLRGKLADVSASSLLRWNQGDRIEWNDPDLNRLYRLEEEISLLINPNEDDHLQLVRAIQNMLRALEIGIEKGGEEFSTARKQVVTLGQKIMRAEWDKVKRDIES